MDVNVIIIFGVTAVIMGVISGLGFVLFHKGRDITDVCAGIAGFWCAVALLAVVASSYLLISDYDMYNHPNVLYVLQSLLIESFLYGIIIWIYGMSRDNTFSNTEKEALS